MAGPALGTSTPEGRSSGACKICGILKKIKSFVIFRRMILLLAVLVQFFLYSFR
jgi:hypothetical protein